MNSNPRNINASEISGDSFGFEFDNSFSEQSEKFYSKVKPTPVKAPELFSFNTLLAKQIGIGLSDLDPNVKAQIFSGNILPYRSEPLSMVYAGHQFGGYVPQLGDGRAILIGETVGEDGQRWDVQLKGAGRTPYSRNGDGRSALGPVIREYILSEAMHALGVKTTRALAAVTTGQNVVRESKRPGGIFTRVALSHIRVGAFEYFSNKRDIKSVKTLADYAINRLYPECLGSDDPYISFYKSVLNAQAELVAKWMSLGFIHGVMNTDNMSISGETIDYGPCAFMDVYNPRKVFSSIDHQGRYAYSNQGQIAQWNLARFGEALLPLIHKSRTEAISIVEESLSEFSHLFEHKWLELMLLKIGIQVKKENDQKLIEQLLNLMHKDTVDFTLCFRNLSKVIGSNIDELSDTHHFFNLFESSGEISDWVKKLNARLVQEGGSYENIIERMNLVNPKYIPRNHLVEQAIQDAENKGDYTIFNELLDVLNSPFGERVEYEDYSKAPLPRQLVKQTFCGT